MYKVLLLLFSLFLLFEMQAQQKFDESVLSVFNYRHVGPTRGGRVTAVAGIAQKPQTFFMGATGGGVWKTNDYGISWENVSDGFFATPSIGDIQVSLSDPNIVYVGTGSDGIRSNIISGKGVYKSTDEGKSWKHMGLEKTGQIGAVEVHPTNSNIVFVAAIGQAFNPNPERGIYRSKNGGESWEQVYFHSDTVGVVDLEFHPTNPEIIYAGLWRVERKPWTIISGGEKAGGILKSSDGGKTWVQLKNGLPNGLIGKADLAVSAADPDRLYVLIEAPEDTKEGGLYRSNNQGESFELVTNNKLLLDRPFYYCNIEADPNNADVLYSLATSYLKSEDAGKTWKRRQVPHGDNHDLWINPNNSNLQIQCNDGGANITTNGGESWSSQNNQPTAEIYQVEVDDQFPFWLYGGQQDNSTIAVPSNLPYSTTGGNTSFWMAVGGCETGPAVPKPGNHNIVYSNCKGRFGTFNKITGQEQQFYVGATNIYGHNPKDLKFRFQRVAPIHVSLHNPDVVYHCSQYVHKTTNDGKSWQIISPDLTAFEPDKQVISGVPITRDITGEEYYSTIYSIHESPVQEGVIWVGANDGPVHCTKNGGQTWENVTPEMPSGGRIDAVEPSPHHPAKAYFCALRYQLGDWKPYIFKTEDFGETWTTITNGIPEDYPVRVVREDPDKEGLLFAGTEYGMFVSVDDGKNWQAFQQNLPITPITDIKIHQKNLVLSTMGRGFWILDNISPLHQLVANTQSTILDIEDAYRVQLSRGGGDGVNYLSPGADIDFFLTEDTEELLLEILNRKAEVIRSFKKVKAQAKNTENEEPDMATGFYRRSGDAGLKSKKGLNRFRWDLRHEGAWDQNENAGRGSGPMVAPGKFSVRITAGQQSFTKSFAVLIDPRLSSVGITESDLIEQEQVALEIRDFQSEVKKTDAEVQKRIKELNDSKTKKKKETARILEKLQNLDRQLNTREGRYETPMLLAQISYLSSMLNQADQAPGQDACERLEELKARFEKIRHELDNL